jgi:hypothetical protein
MLNNFLVEIKNIHLLFIYFIIINLDAGQGDSGRTGADRQSYKLSPFQQLSQVLNL